MGGKLLTFVALLSIAAFAVGAPTNHNYYGWQDLSNIDSEVQNQINQMVMERIFMQEKKAQNVEQLQDPDSEHQLSELTEHIGVKQDKSLPVLGTQFSILHGFKMNWLGGGAQSGSPFHSIVTQNLIIPSGGPKTVAVNSHFGEWIQVSFHPDFNNLLQAFLSIWKFEQESYKSSAFAKQPDFLKDKAAKSEIAKILGIPVQYVTEKNKGFVLARYWKRLQTLDIPQYSTKNTLQQDLSKAKDPDDVIKLFAKYGTHFLSGYTSGDLIYQVFVYDKEVYNDITKQYPQTPEYLFGRKGDNFRLFTQKRYTVPNTGLTVGYSEHVGKVLVLSQDPHFETIRPHLQDTVYKVSESIFKFLTDFTVTKMTDKMTRKIYVELRFKAILSEGVPKSALRLLENWKEAIMVTVFQKFDKESSPNFQKVSVPNYSSYMDTFNPSLVTSTATSHTSILRMQFNLQHLSILNPKFVTDLLIFADVIEIHPGSAITLPGQNSVHIICRKFVSHSYADNIPEVIVSTLNFKIVSSEFVGVLRVVQNTDMSHFTIVNGTVFKTVKDKNNVGLYTVSASDSVLRLPTPAILPQMYNNAPSSYHERWFTNTFINALQLEMVSVQTILSIRASDKQVKQAESSLSWVIQTLSSKSDKTLKLSTDLESVLGQALVINKTRESEYLRGALVVPRLTFPQYKDLFNSMLTLVQSYERNMATVAAQISRHKQNEVVSKTQAELNKNILSIGKFLVNQVKVATKHQQDVGNYHKKIDQMKLNEISEQDAKAKKMLTEVTEYEKKVKVAGDELKKALKQWQKEQIIREAFQVIGAVGSLFSGGANIAALPASAERIARVAAKIAYVVEIIKQVSTLYEQGRDIRTDVKDYNRATEYFKRNVFSPSDFPNELEWSDFDSDVLSMTLGLPKSSAQVTAKGLDFRTAANKLSSRGRAYLNLQKKVQALKAEAILNELQKGVVDRHVSRLTKLQSTLSQSALTNTEANNIDLFELGNILMMKANSIRTKLAQTFIFMDAALQYYYLQDPTPITGYDTVTILKAAVNQMTNSIAALDSFRPKPHDLQNPISYNIPNVKVSSLLSKDGFHQRIPLSVKEFEDYVRVRIIEVEVRLDGITSSADNTIYIEAEASGEIIQDRDLKRKDKTFASYPVTYPYVYNHKTGKTIVGNRPSSQFIDKYMRMTPFVEWTFRIPDVSRNKGIKFSDQITTIRLKFHVNVIFRPPQLLSVRAQAKLDGTVPALLTKMDGSTVLGDWDAICAMDAKETNKLWEKKFNHEVNNGGFAKIVVTDYKLATHTRKTKIFRALSATIGPPKLAFIPHNVNYASLKMTVIKAAVKTKEYICKAPAKRCDNPNVLDDDYAEAKDVKGAYINATVQLVKINGNVKTQNKIMLDFSQGVFDFKIAGLDSDTYIALKNEITKWFKAFQTQAYELGTVDFNSKLTPASLQPHRFYFSTGGFKNSKDGLGTLYIFIKTSATGSKADETTTRDFKLFSKDDHVIPTGYTSALFISSRVIFQDIIKPQFEKQVGVGATAGKPNTAKDKSSDTLVWLLKGSTSGNIKIRVTIQYNIYSGGSVSYDMNIPTAEFTVKGSKSGLKFDWKTSFYNTIKYRYESCGRVTCSGSYYDTTYKFRINAHATSVPTVDSKTSVISFPSMKLGASVTFDGSSGWDKFCCSGQLKDDAAQRTANFVNSRLSHMKLNIRDVSVFALTNLIFPGKKVMNLRQVYMPGDMLVLGDISNPYNPKPTFLLEQ